MHSNDNKKIMMRRLRGFGCTRGCWGADSKMRNGTLIDVTNTTDSGEATALQRERGGQGRGGEDKGEGGNKRMTLQRKAECHEITASREERRNERSVEGRRPERRGEGKRNKRHEPREEGQCNCETFV